MVSVIDYRLGCVSGPIVDYYYFVIWTGLLKHAIKCFTNVFIAVVRWYYYAYHVIVPFPFVA
jgi:hypothetical protein